MDLGLRGRVAVVAAASKGLGRAAARELVREGANVAICARTAKDLEQTASELSALGGGEVFWQAVDVSDPAAVSSFIAAIMTRFSRVDICITNTGGPPSKLFAATTDADWRTWIDQLLMSTVYFAKEVLPIMKKNAWGRFLTITS
jgi:3-oxoacyl-[acyl-carrier protein] reductase